MTMPADHLMDCTHKCGGRSFLRPLIVMAMVALGGGWLATQALADGDPASDVLTTQTLFIPQDAGIPARQQVQLADLETKAQRSGYRIRVAVIASPSDLGSVTALWRQPQTYANFLGEELSLVYRGALLVVMPNGYGLYGVGGVPMTPSALDGLSLPGTAFGTAAIAAIRRLAAASGHDLPLPAGATPTRAGSTTIIPWIVFALGAMLIALAWTASIRARPLRAAPQQPKSA